MADDPKNLTPARAVEIVNEIASKEGPFAQEVAALSVCIGVIEPLPVAMRTRVVKHLHDIFSGVDSLDLLTALAKGANEAKSDIRALTIERDQLRADLDAAVRRAAKAEGGAE